MLSGAELHDSIVTATARPGSYSSGVGDVAMAMDLLDPAHVNREVSEFLRAFGQQSRDEFPANTPKSSLQAMLMMNSQVVLDRVKAEGGSRVDQLLSRLADDRIVIEQSFRTAVGRDPSAEEVERVLDRGLVEKIYLATLSRRPLPAEMDISLGALHKSRKQGLENLQWALLNKPEFLFNY